MWPHGSVPGWIRLTHTGNGTPYFNLGLEPCIGAQDSLAEAVPETYSRHCRADRAPGGWRLNWRHKITDITAYSVGNPW